MYWNVLVFAYRFGIPWMKLEMLCMEHDENRYALGDVTYKAGAMT